MSSQLSLAEAIELLEILNLGALAESELDKVSRRAKRRWHPDRISYQNPSEEKLRRYQDNFVRVDEAIAVIRAYVTGEEPASARSHIDYESVTISPEEAALRHAPANQDTLRKVWERVRASSYSMIEEDVVIYEGRTVKEMLDEDLADDIPATALASLWIGLVLYLVAGLIAAISTALVGETVGSLLIIGLTLAWLAQAIASLTALIPLCRYWLPDKYLQFVGQIVDKTMNVMLRTEEETWSIWIFGIPMLLILVTNWAIIKPVYKLAGLAFSDKVLGRNVVRTKYYAGLSEDYLEYLMSESPQSFSAEELFHLAHAAGELSLAP